MLLFCKGLQKTILLEDKMRNPDLLAEAKDYRGRDEVPADFDAFWDRQISSLSGLPDYQLIEKDFQIAGVTCHELVFEGTNQGRTYARIVLPKSSKKVPIIFHFHGYMGRGWDWSDMLAYTVAGYGVVSMDVRGQSGYSLDGEAPVRGNTVKGQIIRGVVDGPERLFYKDVYLDIYSLVEIVASLDFVDEEHLSSYGASQGGALALVAAALNPRIKQTVAIYPFLSDFRCWRLAIPARPMMSSFVILSSTILSTKRRMRLSRPCPTSM